MSDAEEPPPSSRASRSIFEPGTSINGYTINSLLGQGGFGDVYKVTGPDGAIYALKTEYKNSEKHALHLETSVLLNLNSPYFPKVYAQGETDAVTYYVMNTYGSSLSSIRRAHCSLIPTKTVLYLAIQMLQVIQQLHNCGYIHRDIKPSNFLINKDDQAPLILIDFGLACRYCDINGCHLSQENGRFFGTKRYASLNALNRLGLSRRDDLISWFYSVAELFVGKLPWSSQTDPEKVKTMKANTDAKTLCKTRFEPAPPALLSIWDYLQSLEYESEPNYLQISGLLRDYLRSNFGANLNDFSWVGFFIVEMKEQEIAPPEENQVTVDCKCEVAVPEEKPVTVGCKCAVA